MRIQFKKIMYKNVLSSGNAFTTIDLDRSPSTLITGSNGSGKSTILDAIVFALYGKPFRKINKNQLINTINKKDLLVEIYFSVGGDDYMIRRGIKPNIFEIYKNDQLLNQDAAKKDYQEELVTNIIGINYKSFNQIVVLGSATYVPFMELPTHQRREIIEDLLDIQVFSTMSSLAKERSSLNKEQVSENEYSIRNVKNSISLVKENNDQIKKIRELEADKIRDKMKSYITTIEKKKELIEQGEAEILNLYETIDDKKTVTAKLQKALTLKSDIENNQKKFEKESSFYHENDNCPTCKQGIDHDFKNGILKEKGDKLKEMETALSNISTMIAEHQQRISEIDKVEEEIRQKSFGVSEIKAEVRSAKNALTELKSELLMAEKEVDEVDTSKLETLQGDLKELNSSRIELLEEREVLAVVNTILKDTGVKSRIIGQYVPIMNNLINKYLAAFDLFVDFQLDENFNEEIKSRFRDTFSYSSFSEGEKLRITLSIMLAWRAVAKLRNSVSTNLLILDETLDGALDGEGIENLLETLHSLNADDNVFVISHRGQQFAEKFESSIKFEKVKNFSEMV